MNKKLHIEKTDDTPQITLDAENNIFEISGVSIPENANTFYATVINWFNELFEYNPTNIDLSVKLDYYNSASSKKIVELLILLENFHKNSCRIHINWFYKKNDIIMENKGKELLSLMSIPFDVIEM